MVIVMIVRLPLFTLDTTIKGPISPGTECTGAPVWASGNRPSLPMTPGKKQKAAQTGGIS